MLTPEKTLTLKNVEPQTKFDPQNILILKFVQPAINSSHYVLLTIKSGHFALPSTRTKHCVEVCGGAVPINIPGYQKLKMQRYSDPSYLKSSDPIFILPDFDACQILISKVLTTSEIT